ncbi:MAG: BBE domain-containing protein [Acidimicrobiales bacterium]
MKLPDEAAALPPTRDGILVVATDDGVRSPFVHGPVRRLFAGRELGLREEERRERLRQLPDSDDDTSRVREAYGDHIYRRLAEVKARYDPDNAFHHNKNIHPG